MSFCEAMSTDLGPCISVPMLMCEICVVVTYECLERFAGSDFLPTRRVFVTSTASTHMTTSLLSESSSGGSQDNRHLVRLNDKANNSNGLRSKVHLPRAGQSEEDSRETCKQMNGREKRSRERKPSWTAHGDPRLYPHTVEQEQAVLCEPKEFKATCST